MTLSLLLFLFFGQVRRLPLVRKFTRNTSELYYILNKFNPRWYCPKNLVGCTARFPKPLPYLWQKSATLPTFFAKNLIPCLSPLQLTVALNIIFEGLLFMVLSIVVSSKDENIPNSRLEYKNHTLLKTKMGKSIPYLWPKWLKTIY